MLEPRSSFVNADDLRLHYLEWDSSYHSPSVQADATIEPPMISSQQESSETLPDAIPIVLLHGLSATADAWRLVADTLYVQHTLIAFDQRGHGLSERPDRGYDLIAMAEDIISGMAKLGLGQVSLVGHGWGARVALVLAARHPALVSHLILVDCPHVEPRHWPGMTRERFIREQMLPSIHASRESYLQEWSAELAPIWSPDIERILLSAVYTLPDGRLEELLKPEHQRLIRAALWEDRALSYYAKLHCPVLLIPSASQPVPGEEPPEHLELADEFAAAKGQMAAQVARAIPHCSVRWMPNTSHDIQLQRPEQLAKIISDFLEA